MNHPILDSWQGPRDEWKFGQLRELFQDCTTTSRKASHCEIPPDTQGLDRDGDLFCECVGQTGFVVCGDRRQQRLRHFGTTSPNPSRPTRIVRSRFSPGQSENRNRRENLCSTSDSLRRSIRCRTKRARLQPGWRPAPNMENRFWTENRYRNTHTHRQVE